ncbi:uncharacterized protein LOC123554153 [Mercenaria mercenaria]|uniref:uncharacterized protein LOC123554153 n=1 Tax=Mercenaria mercenaria TaxID=6596 RepID=UPI00234EA9C1|nr:uncharacterized protein LOC123554153 [Mercenaria mercenaria]
MFTFTFCQLNMCPLQIPARIYIPQISVVNRKYETVLKVSIDGSDWVEFLPLEPISNLIEYVRNVEKINGFQVNNFTSIKAFAVNRPRSETIVVDKPGASVRSSMDKHVKLFVVREAFLSRTELQLSVQKFSEKNIEVIVKENTDFRHIHGVTTVITLTCQTPPRKPIEIDISKPHRKQESEAHKHYTSYKLNTMTGECWRFAEVECIRHHEDTTVVLPNGKDKYIVTVLEMPSSLPTGNVPYIAEELYKCVYKTVVKMIVKQNIECPEQCVVRIVGRDECKETLAFLSENGYTEGPEVSAEFCVTEGQRLQICFEGNIETVDKSDRRIEMTYLSYMRGARTQTTLRVKDRGNQKELPAYVGAVKCTVLEIKPEGINYTKTVTLNVALPKQAGTRTVISYTEVRLPYYFTALVNFVSQHLFNKNQNAWRNVLKTLDKAKFQPVHRKAKGKFAENDEKQLCKAMLLHWMKTQTVHVDMLNSIVEALKHNGHLNIAEACVEYVEFQKEYLSDDVLTDLADGISKDSQILGEELGLTKTFVDSCIQANVNNKEQLTAIMMEWRETDDIILYGDTALDHLQQLCV